MSVIPSPFGFGLWTAHFTPGILGCPTVITERFEPGAALDLIERYRVTVLCCVSTQFIMLLNTQAERARDLSSLRSMYTGGEAVPYERAAEFEETTGAKVLQFYGSNETGALSYTTSADTRQHRLRTAGQVIADMQVRLFEPDTGADVTGRPAPGPARLPRVRPWRSATGATRPPTVSSSGPTAGCSWVTSWRSTGTGISPSSVVPRTSSSGAGRTSRRRPSKKRWGPTRQWPWWPPSPCPTTCSANGSASTSCPDGMPRSPSTSLRDHLSVARRLQGMVARAPRRRRRPAPIFGRQGRQRRPPSRSPAPARHRRLTGRMDEDRVYARRWWTLTVLCFSLVIIGVDNTILNVALPSIVRDLGASGSELQWMVDAYTIVFACLLLTAGSLGDRYGRRRALMFGLAWFGAFSATASLATSPAQLIVRPRRSWASAGRSSTRPRCRSSPTPSTIPASGPRPSGSGRACPASASPSGRWPAACSSSISAGDRRLPRQRPDLRRRPDPLSRRFVPNTSDREESPLDPIGAAAVDPRASSPSSTPSSKVPTRDGRHRSC